MNNQTPYYKKLEVFETSEFCAAGACADFKGVYPPPH